MTTKSIGDLGERRAARYLFFRGYRIIERNWFYGKKELDLVARRGKTLVFCEVKTRTQDPDVPSRYGPPVYAVDRSKRYRILTAARAYLRFHGQGLYGRMDVIEVYLSREHPKKVLRIHHIKDVFPL